MAFYLKRISPVLMVERIEPCLPFWERWALIARRTCRMATTSVS